MITINEKTYVEVPRRYGPGILLREVTPEIEEKVQRQVDRDEAIARVEGKPFDRDETLAWVRQRRARAAAERPPDLDLT